MIDITTQLMKSLEKVTKAYTKQRKKEIRSANAASRRPTLYSTRISKKEVLFSGVLEEAYNKASDDGRLPAAQRQIYYAARESCLNANEPMVEYDTFCQYLAEFTWKRKKDWRVIKDARGNLLEPHTGTKIPLGTVEVDNYLASSATRQVKAVNDEISIQMRYPTKGPINRFSALIYIEKEGFNVILEEAGILNRFDVAIASSKGQSVVAVRKFIDEFCGEPGIPLLVVHDFDKSGFEIANALTSDSVRYQFRNKINVVDLGLRLSDVEEYGLQSEPCCIKGSHIPGVTDDEQSFLLGGYRVELNAMTSPQFVKWIEGKLDEHEIEKVIPDAATIEFAYRRVWMRRQLQSAIDREADRLTTEAAKLVVPSDLADEIADSLQNDRSSSWDSALLNFVEDTKSES